MSDFVIIGGGLSGVAFAHFAALRGKSCTILEKRDSLGGCIHTTYPHEDFFQELGAHTIYSSYATIIEMIKNTQTERCIIPYAKQPYKMWVNGNIGSIFKQIHIIELLFNGYNIFKTKQRGLTVEEYYSTIMGRKNYEDLILPVTSAVICQNSATVAADLLLKRRKKDKSYPRTFTVQQGLGALMNSAVSISGIDVHLATEAISIAIEKGEYIVTTRAGQTHKARKLVMAATAPCAATLLETVHTDIANKLKELPMRSSRAVSLCAATNSISRKQFGYIIAKDDTFTAAVSRDMVPHSHYRGVTFHFKPNSNFEDDMNKIQHVLGLKDQDYSSANAIFELPHLEVSHHEWRSSLDSLLAKERKFHLLGNFFEGLSMEDCASRGKAEALRAVN